MKHVPHVVVAAPWSGDTLNLNVMQWRHLSKVLRMHRGDEVSYTDGLGTVGVGRLGEQLIERGEEDFVERGRSLTVAAAPPSNKDRQRYLVEKLTELGVARLVWLRTLHGKNRPASPAKVFGWTLAALEQSRGAWLMEVGTEMVGISDIGDRAVFCDQMGDENHGDVEVVAIGPEGGWGEDEVPSGARSWSLGRTVLRVETAAVVAAARLLEN